MSLHNSINPIDPSSAPAAGAGPFIRSPRISTWAVMRTLLAKDVRAAALPLAIVAVFAVVQAIVFVLHDRMLRMPFDGRSSEWAQFFGSVREAIRPASVVACALPAWVAVELAFLEASPGRRSVLPALPPSLAHVVASKALVLLACVVVLALTVSYAHLNGLYALEARRSGLNLRMLAWTFDRAGILWCWPICTAFALAGLGAPALARDRAVGFVMAFVVAIGVPGVVVFACWGFGFGLEWSAAIAVLACAWLAWIARRAVAGAEVGDIGRILWRRHGGNVSAHRSGDAAGAGHVMRTLLRKDARAVAPVVAAALVFVLGFAAFALALPAFGERVMQQFGIRSRDPILSRLQVAVPVSVLAQLVMPGIAALVLAYCDGRAAGRPMAALPVGRGALAASKVLVCSAVLALFCGISLALDGASARGDGTGGDWMFMQPLSQLWALLLCASGIPWCLALPAFFGDRRAGVLAAVIGVPALFVAFGFAMQWTSEQWYDLITVRLLGLRQWPMWFGAHRASFVPMLPVALAWLAAGAVAAIVAVPAFTASASVARVRRRAVVAVAIATAVTIVGGALAFVLPEVPFDQYQRNLRWEQDVEKAAREEKLENLLQDVVVRAGSVPSDPPRLSEPGARYEETDAPFVLEAILQKAPRVAGLWVAIKSPQQGGPARLSPDGRTWALHNNPRDFALATRVVKEPTEAVREFRRLADDVRVDAGIRIAAASWLGAVPAAMTAARVLAASDTMITERAFATVVLAYLRLSLSSEPIPGADIGLKPFEPGYQWCELGRLAIDALDQFERLALPGTQTAPAFPAAGLGLAPDCVVDESVVRRARERLAHGTSDLCIVLRALGNSNDDNDMLPGQSSSTEVEAACECLQRVTP
jgi:hypothetical protein